MEWESIIATALSSGLMMLLMMYYQNLASKKVTKNIDGKTELRMPKINLYGGIISLIIAIPFLIGLIYIILFDFSWLFILISILMLALFGGIGFWALVSYYNYSLLYNEEKLIYNSWNNEKTTLRWNQISVAKFSPFSSNLTLSNDIDKVKIPYYVPGFQQFADTLESKTKFKRKELKLPV